MVVLIFIYFVLIKKGESPLKGGPSKVATKAIASNAMAVLARVPRQNIWPRDGPRLYAFEQNDLQY